MISELSSRSGQKICCDAEAEIATFVDAGRGGGVRFSWLGEDNGAGGNEVFLMAIGKIPGTTWLESYFELFVKVMGADVGSRWASNNFEVVVLCQAFNPHLRW